MAEKVILKDLNNVEILPITRGELILDSSGNKALHSSEFLATSSLPGLMSPEDKIFITNIFGFDPTEVVLNLEWKAIEGMLFDDKFSTGVYILKITYGSLLFSGIASVYVGEITTDDEIVLHMCGIPHQYVDGVLGRIYAKIAPSETSNYGLLYLATNIPLSNVTNLSITMRKII